MLVNHWSYSTIVAANNVVDAVATVENYLITFALKAVLDAAGLTVNETRQTC